MSPGGTNHPSLKSTEIARDLSILCFPFEDIYSLDVFKLISAVTYIISFCFSRLSLVPLSLHCTLNAWFTYLSAFLLNSLDFQGSDFPVTALTPLVCTDFFF